MVPTQAKITKKSLKRGCQGIDPNSPESFERELKALANKAKEDTFGRWTQQQASAYFKSVALLSLIAVYANVSQLALSPVYGSIPSSLWHSEVIMAACFTGWAGNLFLNRQLPFRPALLLPVIALYIPTSQFFLYELSDTLSARWGPLVTEGLTLFPLMTLSVACVANEVENVDLTRLPRWLADAMPGLGSYGVFRFVENTTGRLLAQYAGTSFLNTRLGLEMLLGASYSLLVPSKLILFTLPALLHTAIFNTHMPTSMALASLNAQLRAEGYLILERKESLTGYISVVENHNQGCRVLRCDHSLLGGEWDQQSAVQHPRLKNNQVPEPIYGVFAMLEAVRLVKLPRRIVDSEAKALVIGLGVGTTPSALVAHGVDTTVIEVDPVVHEFATKYFRVPTNYTAVIEDAVSYTAQLVADESSARFDYIVHDVFTGGAEPVELFTQEFLQNLNALLKPTGVIALNYAGDFGFPPLKIVTRTIRSVFPSCRIYREHPRDEIEWQETGRDFANVVFFCTKGEPVTFRRPGARDLLNSPTREKFLLPVHEVTDKAVDAIKGEEGILRKNDTWLLAKWHGISALGHWNVMRQVAPSKFWENW